MQLLYVSGCIAVQRHRQVFLSSVGLEPPSLPPLCSCAGTYEDIIGTVRTSPDCGTTWTKPQIVWPAHGIEHQTVVTVIKTSTGDILLPCDHWGVREMYMRPILHPHCIC